MDSRSTTVNDQRVVRQFALALMVVALLATALVLGPLIPSAQAQPSELLIAVSANNDDVEHMPNGSLNTGSGDLDVTTGVTIGLRFKNVCVDGPADIASATLELTSDEADTATTNATISGHDIGDAPAFNSTTKVRGLPSTSSTVAWTIPAWNPGNTVASPDIAAVLNDIVGRADWTACNDIVLIVEGTGDREASSHNSNPGQAPQLRIQLNNNPPPPPPPETELLIGVSANNDDIEHMPNGSLNTGSGDLDVTTGVTIGLRFKNVCVDGPADIASATLELTSDEADTATTNATISGHDIGDAPAFNGSSDMRWDRGPRGA